MNDEDSHILLVTTTDNPYSPFTDWEKWLLEDTRLGYDTCSLLARMAIAGEEFDDDEDSFVMERLIELNPYGKHIMVQRADYNPFLAPSLRDSS